MAFPSNLRAASAGRFSMELTQHILTQSDCYKAGRTIVPKGIISSFSY